MPVHLATRPTSTNEPKNTDANELENITHAGGDSPTIDLASAELDKTAQVKRAIERGTPHYFDDDDKILQKARDAMSAWGETFATENGINPLILRALLPEAITVEELLKLKAQKIIPFLEQFPVGTLKTVIHQLPAEILLELPDELLEKVIPKDQVSALKTSSMKDKLGGGFMQDVYKVGINLHEIRNGGFTPEEIGGHECNHGGMHALCRSLLTEEQRISAITDGLKEDITCGAPSVLSRLGFFELPHIPSPKMRDEVARYLGNIIESLGQNDERFRTEMDKTGDIAFETVRLTEKGKKDLLEIGRKYGDFLGLCDHNEESASLVLANLVETQLLRFYFAVGKNKIAENVQLTIPKEALDKLDPKRLEELRIEIQKSPKALEFAKKSTKRFQDGTEGNIKTQVRMGGFGGLSADDAVDYNFCHEETDCYLAGTRTELASQDLQEGRREKLEARKEVYELAKTYMELRRGLKIAPQDTVLVKQEYMFRTAKIKHETVMTELKEIMQSYISPLSNQTNGLSALVEEEAQIEARAGLAELTLDNNELGGKDGFHEMLQDLRAVRSKIKDHLSSQGQSSEQLDEFGKLLQEEERQHRNIIEMEKTLDKKCMNPRQKVTDKVLLDQLQVIEARIQELQQKARIQSLHSTFSINNNTGIISVTKRPATEDELITVFPELGQKLKDGKYTKVEGIFNAKDKIGRAHV